MVRRPHRSWNRSCLVALLGTFGSAPAFAHDFWIEPTPFALDEPGPVRLRLKVGHEKDVKEVARKPERILRFQMWTPRGTGEVGGEAGDKPAGKVQTTESGTHVVVYRSNHAYIELEPDAFRRYLEHEGLSQIMQAREARQEAGSPGKESYARSCKALVTVGEPSDHWKRKVGLPLEIIPLVDPFSPSQAPRFQVLFRGQPLAGIRLDLFDLDDLTQASTAVTNPEGQATLQRVGDGPWLVATTHMIRSGPQVKGDWESFWSTLTWSRPGAAPSE